MNSLRNQLKYGIFSLTILLASTAFGQSWYAETLYDQYAQSFQIDKIIYQDKSDLQDLIIFENKDFGRVFALDGIIQLTERDEYVYHEMLAHTPIIAHGNVKKVLVIGGGDGGVLREVLKHKSIDRVVLVEIDGDVVDFSKKYLPNISKGAFEDPRVEIVIADGCQYIKEAQEFFDVIICDSTDPIGPGEVLFTSEFYNDCHTRLNPAGIFVNQNGVPFMQADELSMTYKNRKDHFKDVGFYLGVIPTYIGGFMAFGWASDESSYHNITEEQINNRLEQIKGPLKYYNAKIHKASFALPEFMLDELKKTESL